MANERLLLKERVDGIDFADVITTAEGLSTAKWTPQPLTLRDDEVSIVENDPEEAEVYSHENDAPEDYSLTGSGMKAVGSFIKASYEQLVKLMGGSTSNGMYMHPSSKVMLSTAVRFRLKKGGAIIIPKAAGSVQFSANMNAGDGMVKYPFSFRALAQTGFDSDIIIQGEIPAEAQAANRQVK